MPRVINPCIGHSRGCSIHLSLNPRNSVLNRDHQLPKSQIQSDGYFFNTNKVLLAHSCTHVLAYCLCCFNASAAGFRSPAAVQIKRLTLLPPGSSQKLCKFFSKRRTIALKTYIRRHRISDVLLDRCVSRHSHRKVKTMSQQLFGETPRELRSLDLSQGLRHLVLYLKKENCFIV